MADDLEDIIRRDAIIRERRVIKAKRDILEALGGFADSERMQPVRPQDAEEMAGRVAEYIVTSGWEREEMARFTAYLRSRATVGDYSFFEFLYEYSDRPGLRIGYMKMKNPNLRRLFAKSTTDLHEMARGDLSPEAVTGYMSVVYELAIATDDPTKTAGRFAEFAERNIGFLVRLEQRTGQHPLAGVSWNNEHAAASAVQAYDALVAAAKSGINPL
ncbi:hypothetical protein HY640_03805 [Candidatus Woesearchaeota archaeon]|nr:hypothetical protein [Candidatus Woesearchaeota archaeon]